MGFYKSNSRDEISTMILDSSVVFKWIRDSNEAQRENALEILRRNRENKISITVPDFLYIELANVLVTKMSLSPAELRLALDGLFSIDLAIYQATKGDLQEAAITAQKYKTSVYDMLYAVLAKKLNTILVTADEKFVKATKFPHVKLLTDIKD